MIDGGLRLQFRVHLRDFHWLTIETGAVSMGVPDAEFCCSGITGWIEYKRTATNAVAIRPEQVAFAERRARAGGRTFLAVRLVHPGGPRKGPAEDRLLLFRGTAARILAVAGLREAQALGTWPGGPAAWDWPRVRELLLGLGTKS